MVRIRREGVRSAMQITESTPFGLIEAAVSGWSKILKRRFEGLQLL